MGEPSGNNLKRSLAVDAIDAEIGVNREDARDAQHLGGYNQ